MGPGAGRCLASALPRPGPSGLLALLALLAPGSAQETCTLRQCLPDDKFQSPPLCYSETPALGGKPATQSFALCPEDLSYCELVSSDPPLESFCRAEPLARKAPGAECFYDLECAGQFAKCIQRRCRRALYTHQACDVEDENDICTFGQRSCFRGRCQGLKTGDACAAQPEGRDIDCAPGWHCFLGVCTPQLPAGHSCTGQHPAECVRGYRCNLALPTPTCMRQYTLDIGQDSSEPTLCKSAHIHPKYKRCAEEPPLELRYGEPVVNGVDCVSDSECMRTDGSQGQCTCKQWWEGAGSSRYCELYIQNTGRPAFKRLWEVSVRLCHHDWTEMRCAQETGLLETFWQNHNEKIEQQNDPTTVKQCATDMLADEITKPIGDNGARHGATPLRGLGVLLVVTPVLLSGAR
jgi:hypothetical protein